MLIRFFKFSILAIPIFLLFSQSSLVAQDIEAKLDKFISSYYTQEHFNGAVLVAKEGNVIFKKGYGFANREKHIRNTPYTKFRIGSITKPFTAMLIIQLAEQEKIKFHEPLSTYLPYYRKDVGKNVSIHHLLTHTSGIPSYTDNPLLAEATLDPYPVDKFIKDFCSDDLLFEPGTQYKYNNTGYFILGGVIEAVTGKTYEEFLELSLLVPAGMNNTGYDHTGQIIQNRASGYRFDAGSYSNARKMNMSIPFAAGALYSTVEDFFHWDEALYSEKLLSKFMTEVMYEPHVQLGTGNCAYGWFTELVSLPDSEESETIISHSGAINGFNALIERRINEKILIVIFSNTPGAELGSMSKGINKILHGISPIKNLPKKYYSSGYR